MGDAIHSHPHPNELTIGCPACIARVVADQENVRWSEAPVRRCTFTVPWSGVSEFSADLRVPPGCDSGDVRDRYEHMLAMKVHELLEATNPANGGVFDQALEHLACTVGPTVEDVQAEPEPTYDIPLFEIPKEAST